jgi:3-dehydroquinate synthase
MKKFPSSIGHIYSGAMEEGLADFIAKLNPSKVFILADENTAILCVPQVKRWVDSTKTIVCKAGEENKNLDSCRFIWSELVEGNADRNSVVLNVGGGMIGDMGGFAASCFQRGIRFVHIPTSLLAMADAAIGGKVGVDYENLKNYIGLIRQAEFIWIDPVFLNTLPEPEIISGLAEIVKHAIIGSPQLWELLLEVKTSSLNPWKEILELNTPVKVKIVDTDVNDQGLRKVLNFGHTIGHAIESYFLSTGQKMTHGQCVATGMMVESKIASKIQLLNEVDFEAIESLLNRLLSPVSAGLPEYKLIRPWLGKDKKKSNQKVVYSLPDRIGSCRWDIPVDEAIVEECFEWWRTQAKSVPFRLSMDK